LKGGYIAEFFSGRGRVSREVRNQGFTAREYDSLRFGDDHDLTRSTVLRTIKQEISLSRILAAFLAPPCGSFSSSNTQVSRTLDDPWGQNPQSCPAAVLSVAKGNHCMRATLSIIKSLEAKHIPWILEHPRTSKCWYIVYLKRLLQRLHITACYLDQCAYGTRWKKATTLLCSRIDECSLARLQKRCPYQRNGICTFTCKKHIVLRGRHPSGVPWTSIAAAYPKALARDIAFVLCEELRYEHLNVVSADQV